MRHWFQRLVGVVLLALLGGACSGSQEPVADDALDGEPTGVMLLAQGDAEGAWLSTFDVDSGVIDRITPPDRLAGNARWSPDGRRIAVAMTRSVNDASIVVHMGSVDGDWTALPGERDDSLPTWSPDCSALAFAHFETDGTADIWIVDADGSNRRRVTDHDDAVATGPDWSPDGARLVFHSNRGGDTEIWTIAPDGSDEQQLTDNDHADSWPRWSPDGAAIAFDRRVGTEKHVYLMEPDGAAPTQLTAGRTRGTLPVWSPDGRWLAYWVRDEALGIVSVDGTDRRELEVAGAPVDAPPVDWGPRIGSCAGGVGGAAADASQRS